MTSKKSNYGLIYKPLSEYGVATTTGSGLYTRLYDEYDFFTLLPNDYILWVMDHSMGNNVWKCDIENAGAELIYSSRMPVSSFEKAEHIVVAKYNNLNISHKISMLKARLKRPTGYTSNTN